MFSPFTVYAFNVMFYFKGLTIVDSNTLLISCKNIFDIIAKN